MSFKNEYVPPLEQETSEFFRKARETLRTGQCKSDAWTVARENNRGLFRSGCGHEIDDYDEEYWDFLDGDDRYSFTTKEISRKVVEAGPPKRIALTRDILYFWGHAPYKGLPDTLLIQEIKEAFRAYGGFSATSPRTCWKAEGAMTCCRAAATQDGPLPTANGLNWRRHKQPLRCINI